MENFYTNDTCSACWSWQALSTRAKHRSTFASWTSPAFYEDGCAAPMKGIPLEAPGAASPSEQPALPSEWAFTLQYVSVPPVTLDSLSNSFVQQSKKIETSPPTYLTLRLPSASRTFSRKPWGGNECSQFGSELSWWPSITSRAVRLLKSVTCMLGWGLLDCYLSALAVTMYQINWRKSRAL